MLLVKSDLKQHSVGECFTHTKVIKVKCTGKKLQVDFWSGVLTYLVFRKEAHTQLQRDMSNQACDAFSLA